MDGRVNFSALERSRLLEATLGHLPPPFPASSDTSHASALSRLGAASAAAAAGASAGAELARAGSPTGIGPYTARYMPSPALQSPGAGYAMMAGYLGGHIPDTLKNLPEFQQYWGSQQYEEYARYLLNMYYPCLPYLPATESLSLFAAQNSATAQAQVTAQVTAQAHAVQHRIYDLQKEAMMNAGALPVGFFPPNLMNPPGQMEATNLSVPGAKKVKHSDKSRDSDPKDKARHSDTQQTDKDLTGVIDVDKYHGSDSDRASQGSERTRGINSARYTCNTDGKNRHDRRVSHEHSSKTTESSHSSDNPKDLRTNLGLNKQDKSSHGSIKVDDTNTPRTHAGKYHTSPGTSNRDHKRVHTVTSPAPTLDLINPTLLPNRPTAFHSPTRQGRVVSPDRRSGRVPILDSGHKLTDIIHGIQDAPENLCVKDSATVKDDELRHKVVSSSVKTQSIVTDTTVTVTSTLTVITSDTVSYTDKNSPNGHPKFPSPRQSSQISPATKLSPGSKMSPESTMSPGSQSSSTSPTYSLPYYHNLFSRTQPPSQDGKKVHAVTYVPEVGSLASAAIGVPTVTETDISDKVYESTSRRSSKHECNNDISDKDHESTSRKNSKHECNSDMNSDLNVNAIHKHSTEDKVSNRTCRSPNKQVNHAENDKKEVLSKQTKVNEEKRIVMHDSDQEIERVCGTQQPTCVQNEQSTDKRTICVKHTSHRSRKTVSPCDAIPQNTHAGDSDIGIATIKGSTAENDRPRGHVCDTQADKRYDTNDTDNRYKTPGYRNPSLHADDSECEGASSSRDGGPDTNATTRSEDGTRNGIDPITETSGEQEQISMNKGPFENDFIIPQDETKVHSKLLNVSGKSNTSDRLLGVRTSTSYSSYVSKGPESTSHLTTRGHDMNTMSIVESDGKMTNNVLPIQKTMSARRMSKEHSSIKTQESSQNTGQNIPVGIAVARQRNIAPKGQTEKDAKTPTEDSKHKAQAPVRPLKVIQPSKGASNTTNELKNVLPANLVVTGGSGGGGNVFWPDEPAARQIAAQFLQGTSQPIPAHSWYTPGPFRQPEAPGTPDSGHVPVRVPAGYKFAQDSLTGQILLIPAGTEVIDHSGLLGAFPVGHSVPQAAPYPTLAGQPPSAIHTVPAIYTGPMAERSTAVDFGRSHCTQRFTGSVLPSDGAVTDVAIAARGTMTSGVGSHEGSQSAHLASASDPLDVMAPALNLTNGHDATHTPISLVQHDAVNKDKLTGVSEPTFAPGTRVTGAYTLPPPVLPLVTNSSVHSLPNNDREVTKPPKPESATVQSRGTSPMLPATDSSNDENEDLCSHQLKNELHRETDKDAVDQCEVSLGETEDVTCPSDADAASAGVDCDKLCVNECDSIDTEYEDIVKIEDDSEDDVSPMKHDDIARTYEDCDTRISDLEQEVCEALTSVKYSNVNRFNNSHHRVVMTEHSTNVPIPGVPLNVRHYGKRNTGAKTDRNIFSELSEYNPFTDPQILQATDGLELLSALAEKSVICPSVSETTKDENKSSGDLQLKQEVGQSPSVHSVKGQLKSKEDIAEIIVKAKRKKKSVKLHKSATVCKGKTTNLNRDNASQLKPRVRCGRAFKPKKVARHVAPAAHARTTTFCGIQIPEDDEVMESMEHEMKLRLAELQRRYREKQRQLAKLQPRKDREKEEELAKENKRKLKDKTKEIDPGADSKRGPGRPKKRRDDPECVDTPATSCKQKVARKEAGTGSHSGHGSCKKKYTAELIVDRVFRKTGSSFKIPLSKNVGIIAPARIELPGVNTVPENNKTRRHKKSVDFGKLIKRSRLSQLNGKDRSFAGGLWHHRKEEKRKEKIKRKEERRKEDKRRSHSTSHLSCSKTKKKEKPEEVVADHGLGLLAEYAVKSAVHSPKDAATKPKSETKAEDEKTTCKTSSPNSPSKKRKPGRPKKCDNVQPGVTETIVAKQSKHMDFFRFQVDEPKPERTISLEGKTPLKPLYLDEWNVRRSERIFLSDPSPQTSPNVTSPNAATKVKRESTDDHKKCKPAKAVKIESHNKTKLANIQTITEKVKKKYATGFSQKSRDKSTDIFKTCRDKLTQKRQERKMKALTPSPVKPERTKLLFDTAHVEALSKLPEPAKCVIGKDELVDRMRILIFMEGLFHEAELQAIRPPDIYGAVLNNERRTRPHICSQEEILKDAIKDVQPGSVHALPEGTRICAYWSQQFSCLYPGTISKGSPNADVDESVVNVEFDDGDSGTIPLEHIRVIPQDFPVVEYDPHPLLLLTKRRRTVSISEGSEPRKSNTDFASPSKDPKAKRPPGRPSKADRMVSVESMGDEDVFIDEEKTAAANSTRKDQVDVEPSPKKRKKDNANAKTDRHMWTWSGSSTKRPGLKGKARKDYYKSIVRDREILSVGESAVFVSTGRPNLPYVGHIDNLYESWGGQMVVKVKWFYHPEETKGGKKLQNAKGALFRSDHEDENDVQTISRKCEVLSFQEYNRRKDVLSVHEMTDVYYLAGTYQPTQSHIDFEPGVV